MSDANIRNATLTGLENDIASLKRDVASLIGHLKVGAADGAQGAARHIGDGASGLYDILATESGRAAKGISRQIEQQPLIALLIAIGIGYAGGRFLSR